MAIYDDIRAKIEELGGAAGPEGSFNHKGGTEIVIKYETDDGIEEHHIVPYLIGLSPKPNGSGNVKMLLAYKYKGTSDHPGVGFRCYKVGKIDSLPATPAPDPRPSSLPKVKIKRQTCVEEW